MRDVLGRGHLPQVHTEKTPPPSKVREPYALERQSIRRSVSSATVTGSMSRKQRAVRISRIVVISSKGIIGNWSKSTDPTGFGVLSHLLCQSLIRALVVIPVTVSLPIDNALTVVTHAAVTGECLALETRFVESHKAILLEALLRTDYLTSVVGYPEI